LAFWTLASISPARADRATWKKIITERKLTAD
jgi:hypothetical protein